MKGYHMPAARGQSAIGEGDIDTAGMVELVSDFIGHGRQIVQVLDVENTVGEVSMDGPGSIRAPSIRLPTGTRPSWGKEIANANPFLALDESCFVTGSPLRVDGGYLAC